MIKKIISFVFLSLTISLLHSCIFPDYNYKEHLITSGDFKYIEGRYPNDKGYVYLIELSEEGLKKDTIVVPVEIDGKPVKGLGYSGRNKPADTHMYFKLSNISKVYIPSEMGIRKNRVYIEGYSTENLLTIMIPDLFDVSTTSENEEDDFLFVKYLCNNMKYYYVDSRITFNKANLSYIIDDDVYFIDDCNGTVVNAIPPNPVKEGYRFDGWYKDKDYTQKWNFETDIVPPKQYDEDGNYIYQETSIYAKFTYIGE